VEQLKKVLAAAKVTPAQAIEAAQKEVAGGKAVEVDLEVEKDAAFYEVVLLVGETVMEVKVDTVTGKVLATKEEQPEADEADELAAAKKALAAAKLTFAQALATASREVKDAKAFKAELEMKGDQPTYAVRLLQGEKVMQATVDGATGKVLSVVESQARGEQKEEKEEDENDEAEGHESGQWRQEFKVDKANWADRGDNPYFPVQPGYRWRYKHGAVVLTITVLDETKVVDGVTTRVVEEREEKDGQPLEVARNYLAVDKSTGDVYYFGEDVDEYKDGKVAGHEGTWQSGQNGARFGLLMPGKPKVGDRFYQERAPKVAMDRAEIVSLDEKVTTPAGTYEKCLDVKETSALEKGVSHKLYASGVGLVKDDEFVLESVQKPAPKP
jgi:uncharacterized membrane protein YkoI